MIIDITGVELTPGHRGIDCIGNGRHYNKEGNIISCCDGCDYLYCCTTANYKRRCRMCEVEECPRAVKVHYRQAKEKSVRILQKEIRRRTMVR